MKNMLSVMILHYHNRENILTSPSSSIIVPINGYGVGPGMPIFLNVLKVRVLYLYTKIIKVEG